MELYISILKGLLNNQNITVTFPDLKDNLENIITMKCYQAFQEIKDLIEDKSLSDTECLVKIVYILYMIEK